MLIYVVRHAWAEEADAQQWPDDGQRPLTTKGAKRFARVMKKLARRGFAPARIATSPLVRCRQTAEIIAERLERDPPIDEIAALAPGSDLGAALAWTAKHTDLAAVAWVGHAPDVGRLTAELIGSDSAEIEFGKGAVAAIEVHNVTQPGCGSLIWFATAALLGV